MGYLSFLSSSFKSVNLPKIIIYFHLKALKSGKKINRAIQKDPYHSILLLYQDYNKVFAECHWFQRFHELS